MSALLDQFVEEAGDLLTSAGSALLLLERNPLDTAAVNDLFRSVHTLKGTSALFDFPALTKLVHAGEDLLDAVRDGEVPVCAELVDVQLEVLDLLRDWLQAIRTQGDLPADAASSSRDILLRLLELKAPAAASQVTLAKDATAPRVERCTWLSTIPEADRLASFATAVGDGLSLLGIAYEPDSDCYFRGEDPFLTCRSIPDLLALLIESVGPEPPLATFDPYQCRLRFHGLSTAPRAELEHLFRYVSEQVWIGEISPEELAVPEGSAEVDDAAREFVRTAVELLRGGHADAVRERAATFLGATSSKRRSASAVRWLLAVLAGAPERLDWQLQLARSVGGAQVDWSVRDGGPMLVPPSEHVDRVIAEQRLLLTLPSLGPVALAGRIASVGRTLRNVAASVGVMEAARRIDEATRDALAAGQPQTLLDALEMCFGTAREAPEPMAAKPIAAANAERPKNEASDAHHIRTLKVDQAKVDRLMALIGELVVAKNALPFLARRAENVHGSRELGREIGQRYSVIDRLAQEMQEAIMEVRLLPVSEVFARFPRLIRDVSRRLEKRIELVLEGEETQADKNIIELLGDPLIHIVRNAADHGIESPKARAASGKPAHGTIRLRAMQEGDRVVIEVSDDGRGIDTARVIQKALERGIIDADEAARLGPAEAANLIFHPGLSTADEISDLSGRGVGMDVVLTAIRDAGGSVNVTSEPNVGTKVRLALPLSMAVMRVMTIETAGTLFGVPIDIIAETVRIDATSIRGIKQAEAFLLRDTIVPLVRLRQLLQLPPSREDREAVLVLRTGGGLVGVIVDRFDEHMDIILKPLEGILAGLRGFAGTALLGDGRVLMVLDVKELL